MEDSVRTVECKGAGHRAGVQGTGQGQLDLLRYGGRASAESRAEQTRQHCNAG